MPDLSNIILHESIKFIIAFHLGSLIFFSSIIAPTTFNSLKEVNARKFIRKVFPRLYMWSIIIMIRNRNNSESNKGGIITISSFFSNFERFGDMNSKCFENERKQG